MVRDLIRTVKEEALWDQYTCDFRFINQKQPFTGLLGNIKKIGRETPMVESLDKDLKKELIKNLFL